MKLFKLSDGIARVLIAMGLIQARASAIPEGLTCGVVKYVNNTLHVIHEISLDKAWDAANAAWKKLPMPVTTSEKDWTAGKLAARHAENQSVIIQAVRKAANITEIQISVGAVDHPDRTQAREIHARMKARF